jgi:hypothetical protein
MPDLPKLRRGDAETPPPGEIAASRFLWLIGVFVAALLLVAGLKAFFSHLQDELRAQSANERARLFVGEEVVRGIQAIETDVYHMTTLAGEAALVRQENNIREHVAKLEHDLKVLKEGGSVARIMDLNIEGRDQMVSQVTYWPSSGAGFVMELIEIAPLAGQINDKSRELRQLLGQRMVLRDKRDMAGLFQLEQRIMLHLKHLPPFFLRLNENANRLFFESSERLEALERQLGEQRER